MNAHRFSQLAATTLAVLLLLSIESRAQTFIVGQVVDPNGVGVPGVDIDVDNLRGGGDPDLFNDGTDPGGFFTTTVENAGVFHFFFRPPPPPATSLLVKVVPDVVTVGTTNMGVIQLEQGVPVSGRVVGPTGLPAGGVNFDLLDGAGNLLEIAGGFSDLFGNFSFAAPAGPVEWRFNTLGVITEVLAPTALDVTITGPSMAMGDVVLPRGYHFMATLLRPNGLPLPNTDTDTFDSATGELVYTPSDNSSSTGLVDLVLAAGTYDFVVCPTVATGIAAMGAKGIPVVADFNAGPIMTQSGFLLSGVVRDGAANPVGGVNIDIEDSNGDDIFLCGDSTNAAGQYQLIVPPGTWTLEYKPNYALPLGASIQGGVTIGANMVNNVVLPACPTHTPYGTGLAGKGGFVPALSASGGSARLGNPNYALEITGGLGRGQAMIVSGLEPASMPFQGGTLLVDGVTPPTGQSNGLAATGIGFADLLDSNNPVPMVFGVTTVRLGGTRGVAGTGALSWPDPIPSTPVLAGLTRYVQVVVKDKNAVQGVSLSNGISITYCE